MNKEILISATDLKKYFPVHKFMGGKQYVKAVDGVSLEINKGETFGLVGESGCGKSTLERTLIRMYDITDGKVTYKGKDITNEKAKNLQWMKDEVQIIFQDPYSSLNPRKHIYEILSQPMLYHGISNKETVHRDVDRLLDMVGLSKHVLGRYPHEFSGGQRQRICIARALALNPEFVVCDEPVSALDVSVQAQIINLLKELQEKRNLTYLFISHDLSVVEHISDTIGVMYLGKLVELADSFELIAHSVHPYTRSLISAIPVADPVTARQSHRIVLQGDVPSPLNPPSGCRFRTRCPYADERCAAEVPEFKEVSSGHWAACHHLDKVK